jgi:hypothetical protein
MVKVIDVQIDGYETKCEHCGKILHYTTEDVIKVAYVTNSKYTQNLAIDCPNCKCRTCLHKD